MDLYVVSLATGATGLVVMAASGLSHLGAGHAGHAGHDGHGHTGHDVHIGHGHAGHGVHAGHAHAGEHGDGWLQSLLSPRVLFSVLIGFGAGGLLSESLGGTLQLIAAIVGAVIFEALLVGPLWRFLFRFESRPALTLESAIEDDARAVTAFDASGCGLVALEVDGQIVQLLATLNADERARGVRVRAGDVVRVANVDPARGRCIVRTPDR
jgi:hypothetical protein